MEISVKENEAHFIRDAWNKETSVGTNVQTPELFTNEQFTCDVSGKIISPEGPFNKHYCTHNNDKLFSSNVFHKEISDKYHPNGHDPIHANEKLYSCDITLSKLARLDKDDMRPDTSNCDCTGPGASLEEFCLISGF
ncbi:hypothetical protein HNY73_019050 [Argiope bruennichi]|uniref:Uncharacterized protein n=1 Tax=Argiope bruennichi TaxID=94029 RepID=A0A8T0EJY7_ARGBR|nr:hypothetical protein HNY73_019050 [Argiope bruennichi]